MILLYLNGIGLIHFLSATTLGIMSVLSGKAFRDLFKETRDERR